MFPGVAYLIDVFLDYDKDESLGDGTFGEVYKFILKAGGKRTEPVDCKYMKLKDDQKDVNIFGEKLLLFLRKVFALLCIPNHLTILTISGWNIHPFGDYPRGVILTPYMENKALNVIKFSRLPQANTKKMIVLYGIARRMKFLHSFSIVHRNLKPGNIFLDGKYYHRIADFGLAKLMNEFNKGATQQRGTWSYMAPEVMGNENDETSYELSVDVYSCGIIFAELIEGKSRFLKFQRKEGVLRKAVQNGERPDSFIPVVSSSGSRQRKSWPSLEKSHLLLLLQAMWSSNPDERPSFDEIVKELESTHLPDVDLAQFNEYKDFLDREERKLPSMPSQDIMSTLEKLSNMESFLQAC